MATSTINRDANQRVLRTLATTFLLILIAFSALFWKSSNRIDRLTRGFEEIRHHDLLVYSFLTDIERTLMQLRMDVADYGKNTREAKQEILGSTRTELKTIRSDFAHVEHLFDTPFEQLLYAKWKSYFSLYVSRRPRYFELMNAGRVTEANAYRQTLLDPPAAVAYEAIKSLVDFQNAEITEKESQALAQESAHQRQTVIFYLVGAFFALGIFSFLLKTVVQYQRRLVADNQVLQHAAKMSSLGEMAGGIAHEINNPLAIIHGKAGLIRQRIEDRAVDYDKLKEDLGKIELTAERIAKIIKGLKTFSRNSEADPMEQMRVSQIVDDTLELCKERFRNHSIELRVRRDNDAILECRPSQISQVLMNLLGNAHDAVESLPERWVELEVKVGLASVTLQVTDSGKGIAPPIADKMMQPFFTTKAVGRGTGLGLSISKGITDDHNGLLKYDPSCLHTRFVLELPLRQPIARILTA